MQTDSTLFHRLSTTLPAWVGDHLFSVEHNAHLWILERNATTLTVRWVQPGRCHYAEQRWRLVAAGRNGICAISGLPVRKGDIVYRPDARPSASNAKIMILENALLHCENGPSQSG